MAGQCDPVSNGRGGGAGETRDQARSLYYHFIAKPKQFISRRMLKSQFPQS